jgi:hypothetical protein
MSRKLVESAQKVSDLSNAAQDLASMLQSSSGSRYSSSDYLQIEPEFRGTGIRVSIRYWGVWENPSDTPRDEEDDYDWQVLSKESSAKLTALLKTFQERHPNIRVDSQGDEKNWISFLVNHK